MIARHYRMKGAVLASSGRTGRTHETMSEYRYLSLSDVVPEVSSGAGKSSKEAISRAIIGERVRQARIAANMTQQELAGATYSKSYISAVERGKMTPSFQALHTLAERLGRPISFFLGEGEVSLATLMSESAAASSVSEEERQQHEAEAREMLKEAETFLGKNQAEKALEALHVAIGEPPDGLAPYDRPRWYWLAGWAGVWARQFSEAKGWLERGLEVVEEARVHTPPTKKAQLLEMAERIRNLLGVCYYEQAQPAKAREYHLQCLAAMTSGIVTDPELKLLIYKSLANDHMALGHHTEAILYYKEACKLAEDMNDPRQWGLAYWGLGLAYEESGDLFHAEVAIGRALELFKQLNDTQLVPRLHAMLGQLLTKMEDYQRAEEHLAKALKAAEQSGNIHARGVALGNIASLHLARGNPDEAIKAAQEGLRPLRGMENYRTEGQLYETLARAYAAKQDISAAEQAYKEAITILEHIEGGEYLGRAHDRYGQFLAAQGRFAEAYEQMGIARKLLDRK